MAIVTKTRTYNTGDVLPAGYYNADRDEIIAGVNSIDNAQVSPTAGILESKIAFNIGGGHHHDGIDSRLIQVSWAVMDFTGLTANYPVFINATADGFQTHLIGNTDIDVAAAIVESKLIFDIIAGHDHDGVNSKAIVIPSAIVPRTYILTAFKELVVETDVSPNPVIDTNISVTALTGYVQTVATGADLICVVKEVGGATIGTLTIPATNNSAILDLSGSPVAVSAGVFLELDITQVGSTIAGSKLTVSVTATKV